MSILFQSNEHKERVLKYLDDTNKIYDNGKLHSDYLVAYNILLSDNLYDKSAKNIDYTGINFQKIKRNCYTNTESLMVKVAESLYYDKSVNISLSDLATDLDQKNYNIISLSMDLKKYHNQYTITDLEGAGVIKDENDIFDFLNSVDPIKSDKNKINNEENDIDLIIAKGLIANFSKSEYGYETIDELFDDLTMIPLAYTTHGDHEEIEVQIYADLINRKMKTYINNELRDEYGYDSIEAMIAHDLNHLDFDSLTSISNYNEFFDDEG